MFPLIPLKIAEGQLNNIYVAGKMVIDPECCVTYLVWWGACLLQPSYSSLPSSEPKLLSFPFPPWCSLAKESTLSVSPQHPANFPLWPSKMFGRFPQHNLKKCSMINATVYMSYPVWPYFDFFHLFYICLRPVCDYSCANKQD